MTLSTETVLVSSDITPRQKRKQRYLVEYNSVGTVNGKPIPCCKKCGDSRTLSSSGDFYCSKCRVDSVLAHRNKNIQAVQKYQNHWRKDNYLYGIWSKANYRCHKPNYQNYSDYGGRGISVFEDWRINDNLSKKENLVKYEIFKQYIISKLGHKPSEDYSLDRINNNGNYEPGNLKWSTRIEQANNQRKTLSVKLGVSEETLLYYQGELITLKRMSEVTGIDLRILKCRYMDALRFVDEDMWKSMVDFFTGNRIHRYKDVWYSLKELSLISGILRATIRERIYSGQWSVVDAVETPVHGKN